MNMVLGDDFPHAPRYDIMATAGPSKSHPFPPEMLEEFEYGIQQSHRAEYAKALTHTVNDGFRRMMRVKENPSEFEQSDAAALGRMINLKRYNHIVHTKGGTDGMAKAVLAVCPPDGKTLLINTDNFSLEVLKILRGPKDGEHKGSALRPVDVINFERGKGLMPDTEEFEKVAQKVERAEYDTIYLTENGTTTGVNQRAAIQELVRRRDTAKSKTIIVVDGVSTDLIGTERNGSTNADIFFTGCQKDEALGGVAKGTMLINGKAMLRAQELQRKGVYIGGKENILADVGKGENQSITTPSVMGLTREAAVLHNFRAEGSEAWRQVGETQIAIRDTLVESATNGELAELGYGFLTKDSRILSRTSHVVTVPADIDAKEIGRRLRENHSISIGGGYGKKNKARELRPCAYSANTEHEFRQITAAIAAETRAIRAAV